MNIDISVREFFGTDGASVFVRFGMILGLRQHTHTRGSVHYFAAITDAQPSCHHFDERESLMYPTRSLHVYEAFSDTGPSTGIVRRGL